MKKFWCIACNGLHEEIFANPLTQLAYFLNRSTPPSVHFNVIGGMDPRPFINQYIHNCEAAASGGYTILMLGHSLGAMMMFYLADAMKARDIKLPLVVSIDSTDWGTNAAGVIPYSLESETPGHYWVPDNVDHWVHIRQPVYPGGGIAHLASGNEHTKFENHERVEPHVVLPITPAIQQIILKAVLEAIA